MTLGTKLSPARAWAASEGEPAEEAPEPKRFYLFGYPIAHSAAPAFHNECFAAQEQSHHFAGWSTSAVTDKMLTEIRADASGGAAVTMPLKTAILEHLDELTVAARATGACNTIVKVRRVDGGVKLVGTNTDVLGVRNALLQTLKAQHPTHAAFTSGLSGPLHFEPGMVSAVVIGGGATTRSAIYALSGLGLAPIFLLNRDDDEVRWVVESFQVQRPAQPFSKLIHIRDVEDVERYLGKSRSSTTRFHGEDGLGGEGEGRSRERSPNLAIIVSAIPAIAPATPSERLVYALTTSILSQPYNSALHPDSSALLPLPSTRMFLDMAYKPRMTPLLRAAAARGWDVIGGVQAMVEQGLAQQRMWAVGAVDDSVACAGVEMLGEEVERRARQLVENMDDIEVDGVEVDLAGV